MFVVLLLCMQCRGSVILSGRAGRHAMCSVQPRPRNFCTLHTPTPPIVCRPSPSSVAPLSRTAVVAPREPTALLEGKNSAANFNAELKPLSSYVFGGVDYLKVDSIKVSLPGELL